MPPMDGRVCIVTGANSGIGKETARALGEMGAHVVMVCRSRERGDAARAEIAATATGRVELLLADLSSLAQTRRVAGEILERYSRIGVLVNNAGLYRLSRTTTGDGFETTFAVNHLAPFLLTNLLIERLRESAPSRMVAVASGAHSGGRIAFDDLGRERGWRYGWPAYCQSKLANVMFTYALARRLEGSDVTANCLHPGFVVSNFGSGNAIPVRPFMMVARPFGKSPEQGARTPIYLASSPEVEGVSGKYFVNRREARSSSRSYEEDVQERLWRVSEEMTGLRT